MTDKCIRPDSEQIQFEGAVSLDRSEAGVQPWRLPFHERSLFSPGVVTRAGQPSGVRLTFLSDTSRVCLDVEPVGGAQAVDGPGTLWTWDLLLDGVLAQRVQQSSERSEVIFDGLPRVDTGGSRMRRIEIFFPSQYLPVRLRSLFVARGASVQPWTGPGPRFVMYGSSITQAKEAAGPSETWACIVASKHDLHLTNLGFGGQEHVEAGIARVMRDLPADVLGLCVGGNVHASASLSSRTFLPAVIDFVRLIREGHPRPPIAVCSCIHMPEEVGKKNVLGLSLDEYRGWTREAVEKLQALGDERVIYVHGPDLYSADDAARHTHDGAHPDAEGQRLLGERFSQLVMPGLLALR